MRCTNCDLKTGLGTNSIFLIMIPVSHFNSASVLPTAKKSTTQYHFHPHWQKVKSKLWSEPFKGLFVAELLVSGSTLKSHKVVSHSPVRDRGTYKDWVACIPCSCHTMLKQCITSPTFLSYQHGMDICSLHENWFTIDTVLVVSFICHLNVIMTTFNSSDTNVFRKCYKVLFFISNSLLLLSSSLWKKPL